ncbi:unnamed protein product [Clonostachys chloroleuca]|uniref:Uncharacterized protein n=1 Tax=Clonostachys chloroleuca TaxID=1926264 RepID=A0AA35LTG3_9HYPO|nr:unnamed protein product [Clonostachys chloroleuca]
MPLSRKNHEIFDKIRRRKGIVFSPELTSEQWPEGHRSVLEAIETAKSYRYSTYQASQDETTTKPWKIDAKRQAKKLVAKSKDCVSRNEATWRLACESLVFSRLAAEVACQTCRQRVWRSEIESSLDDNNRASSSLRKRQQQRERCRCPMSSRPDGEEEMVGLNKLFIDRADDMVVHPPKMAEELPQDQRPDRVYGLRQTRKFDELLLKKIGNGIFVEDRLQEQPHSTVGEALLFPFMVVEAKAGNAADEWHDIKLQTAFPIYTYLQTQQSLRAATGSRCRWDSGPLVWFFCSRGDDWRLFLAYQSRADAAASESPMPFKTIIAPVWTGCTSNLDAALQLFLIVDFIADWARDVYRASIITELRILSSPTRDVSTVASETFVFSTQSIHGYDKTDEDIFEESKEHRNDLQDAFKDLDSSFGAVRHIAPIESRFRALFITEDNVQTFLSSMEKSDRELFVKRVLTTFDRPQYSQLSLTGDNISSIEEAWTGNTRLRTPFNIRESRLNTLLVVTYHLSPSWEQIRELCLISITKQAFDLISCEAKVKAPPSQLKSEGDFSWVVDKVAQLKDLSAADNLSCCISRVCVYLDDYRLSSVASQLLGRFEKCDATVWELVNYTYKQHKRGDLEPDLPFLRLSITVDVQMRTKSSTAAFARPLAVDHQLRWSRSSTVLVYGSLHRQGEVKGVPSLCVYLNEFYKEPPSVADLARIITTTFQDHDVYHTTRDNGNLKLRTWNIYRDIWNLRNNYGVFFSYGDASFSKWLGDLGFPPPSRQGSPRGPFDTGRTMFERKYNPWQDPRLANNQARPSLRKKFVKELIMAEALEWARLARQSIMLGNACCCLCGGELDSGDGEPEFLYEVKAEGTSFDGSGIRGADSSESAAVETSSLMPYNFRSRCQDENAQEKVENLCLVCTEHMFLESHWGEGWQDWMREVLRMALCKSMAEDVPEAGPVAGPSRLDIMSTPPLPESPHFKRYSSLGFDDDDQLPLVRKRRHSGDGADISAKDIKPLIIDLTSDS